MEGKWKTLISHTMKESDSQNKIKIPLICDFFLTVVHREIKLTKYLHLHMEPDLEGCNSISFKDHV